MNMNKSFLKSNLRGTNTKPLTIIDIEPQLMDENLLKSYMYVTAQKTGRKKNQKSIVVQKFGNFNNKSQLLKSYSQQKRYKIFKSVLQQQKRQRNTYYLMMTNVGEKPANMNCCQSQARVYQVSVTIGNIKNIIIRMGNQIIYQFNFNTIKAKIDYSSLSPTQFVLNIKQDIILKFEIRQNGTLAQINQLKQTLQKIINQSLGKQFEMKDLLQIQGFEKRKYISAIQFQQNCDTGDVLLFRGSLFWAKVQRFLTNSDYDHVGMVYKDPIHGILIFESTSHNGICLSPWQYVLKYKWYKYIDRIVWRKLDELARQDQFLDKMQTLIMQKLGKAYHISLQKLWINVSYVHPNNFQNNANNKKTQQEQEKEKKQSEGYFCSELLAKIYKGLELLPTDRNDPNYKPSNNTYPYHFTEKYPLILKKGKLAEQAIIHFNPQAIQDYYGFD